MGGEGVRREVGVSHQGESGHILWVPNSLRRMTSHGQD